MPLKREVSGGYMGEVMLVVPLWLQWVSKAKISCKGAAEATTEEYQWLLRVACALR